jgi:hypothetical protein
MSSAGQLSLANRIPGERIGASVVVADSGTFTAETVVMTLVVPLVAGRTYSVFANPGLSSSVAADVVGAKLREDSITGTVLDSAIEDINDATAPTTRKHALILLSDYTALSTANKTFVVTGERATGTGNVRMPGSSARKSYLLVRYESG